LLFLKNKSQPPWKGGNGHVPRVRIIGDHEISCLHPEIEALRDWAKRRFAREET